MAGFLSSCASFLSGCLFMAARVTLFASCLMIAITRTAYIFSPPGMFEEDPVSKSNLTPEHNYAPYFASGLMLGVALCGLYGSCTQDPRSLRLFALLITIIAVLHGFGVYDKHAENDQELHRFNLTMKTARPLYSWSTGSLSPATELWNVVQERLECCGLVNQSEWFHHVNKPAGFSAKVLPSSCCSPLLQAKPNFVSCTSTDAFKAGCLGRYEQILASSVRHGIVSAFFYVSLVILALFVAEHKRPPTRPVIARYSQFNNSVYTWRPQPPVRQMAGEKPPAYVAPNVPPPSYTFA